MKYTINLVRQLRREELKAIELKNRIFTIGLSCGAVLGIAVLIMVFQTLAMQTKLSYERQKLARVEMEYSKYKKTRMEVNKADIERLDSLQADRVFWTKKVAAMAYYLPDNFWITKFIFDGRVYRVSGFGYISPKQEQLITLDDYLNKLRADSTYKDVFKSTFFNAVARADEDKFHDRVSFEYSSTR
jgi:hypothetical protein